MAVVALDAFAYGQVAGAVVALAYVQDPATVDPAQLAAALARVLLDRLHITVPTETILAILPDLIENARMVLTKAVAR